jgi:outer membrane autotransporter protein
VLGRLASASGSGFGAWAQVLYRIGTDNGGQLRGVGRMRSDMRGAIGGLDMGLGDRIRIGVAGGYTRDDLHVDSRGSSARIETTHLVGYAAGRVAGLSVKGELGYAWSMINVDRTVAFAGFASELRSRYDGSVLHGTIDAGYPVPTLGGTIEPFAAIEGYRVSRDSFVESGADAALSSGKRTEAVWISTLGARAETPVTARLTGRGQLGWRHALDDFHPSSLMRFTNGTVPFRVNGVPLAGDAVSAAIGLDWKLGKATTLSGAYAGIIGKATDESRLSVMLSLAF